MPIYNEIAHNNRNTVFLFVFFFVFVLALGFVFGLVWGIGSGGLAIAGVIAIIWSLIGYYSGTKIVLAVHGAKLADETKYLKLHNIVEGMAIAAGIPKPKVYVMQSNALNAFATGRNPKNSVICFTTGIIEKLNKVELEGVTAHEMSHIKNYDIKVMTMAAVLAGIIMILSDLLLRGFWFGGSGRKDSGRAGMLMIILGIVLAILAPLIATVIKLSISRQREYLADASGAMLTRYPKGLASALAKISGDTNQLNTASNATSHLFISNPFKKKNFLSGLFQSHPPIEERIKRLNEMG